MKIKTQPLLIALALLLSSHSTFAAIDDANTVLSFQGQLVPGTPPIWSPSGYDLTFTLFNTNNGGTAIAGPVTNLAVTINTNSGVFTTFPNFGSNVDNTHSYWLEIGVRTNGGGAFITLSPRQTITPAPQAYYAGNAGVAAVALTATNFAGAVSGDVSGPQGATVVSATSASVPNAIIARDGSGSFSAGSASLGGSLYLPFPAVIYSGTNTVFVEEGSTFEGLGAGYGAAVNGHDVGIGDYVLSSSPTGQYNTGIGENSLQYDTTGSNNTAGGFQALQHNTTGSNNKADGYKALYSNTTGGNNTANGSQALYANTTGSFNDAYGFQTLYNASSVDFNSAFGSYALRANTSGSQNAAFGFEALFANLSGVQNTASGIEALWSNTAGSFNTANGFQALYYNTASYNTANGFQALVYNTSGADNTADGYESLYHNTTGYGNEANGYQALYNNANGYYNTADGYQALFNNTSGYDNTANGWQALYSNTSGWFNSANGIWALFSNTSGNDNTANGYSALHNNTIGILNTANGVHSLLNNTTGTNNTASGAYALEQNITGSQNTADGAWALNNSSGTNNIALGFQAGQNLVTGNNNIDLGNQGVASEYNTIRVGVEGMQTSAYFAGIWGTTLAPGSQFVVVDGTGHLGVSATGGGISGVIINSGGHVLVTPSGSSASTFTLGSDATPDDLYNAIVSRDTNGSFNANNIALGNAANCSGESGVLTLPTTSATAGMITLGGCSMPFLHGYGTDNFFGGLNAGNFTMSGGDDTAVGANALFNNTSGYENTAVGSQALVNNSTGYGNTAVGYQALFSNTNGYYNVASGWQSLLSNTSGWFNTADGIWALRNNTTGDDNTASGYNALGNNTTGRQNTGYGVHALHGNSAGSQNIAVGWWSLNNAQDGTNDIAVGYQAGINFSGAESGNIDIGNAGVGGDNNTIRIGALNNSASNDVANTYISGIWDTTLGGDTMTVIVDASGHLGTQTSSGRYKENISDMADASDALLGLRPVTFQYKHDATHTPQFGLVAEEVNKLDSNLVVRDRQGQIVGVRYEAVNAMLLNEFLKQHQKVEAQNTEIESLKEKAAQVEALAGRLDELQTQLKQLAAQK